MQVTVLVHFTFITQNLYNVQVNTLPNLNLTLFTQHLSSLQASVAAKFHFNQHLYLASVRVPVLLKFAFIVFSPIWYTGASVAKNHHHQLTPVWYTGACVAKNHNHHLTPFGIQVPVLLKINITTLHLSGIQGLCC